MNVSDPPLKKDICDCKFKATGENCPYFNYEDYDVVVNDDDDDGDEFYYGCTIDDHKVPCRAISDDIAQDRESKAAERRLFSRCPLQ